MGAEKKRLEEDKQRKANWRKWGPYLPERQWGTVREDYSEDGNAWEYTTYNHDGPYRWGDDGIAGISDTHGKKTFAFAFWNGKDRCVKRRLFGLTNSEGNHGEDVKECYYYLDNTPTHSYMKYLYKYPQKAFPYDALINHGRTQAEGELELIDTGIFSEDRYFDCFIEYAKKSPEDIAIRLTVVNRGPEAATIHIYPRGFDEEVCDIGAGDERCFRYAIGDIDDIDATILRRKEEADEFYREIISCELPDEYRKIYRQALSGMLWNKQHYTYIVEKWEEGRVVTRNSDWKHLYSDDILSVPDKWEYPAFFSWDMAFHTIPLSIVDSEFAKKQLILLTREWYMHPNGQIPAYEWDFGDVNPPVHAWATWRVFKIEKKRTGKEDRLFLERVFQKLLMNFTWWVNRKDADDKNIFQGGFLGLDNISVFNRSEDLPPGSKLYQSDATSWMAAYSLNMLTIALELAKTNSVYEDIASKFYEHFLRIALAINFTEGDICPLWNDEDGFYYDVLTTSEGTCVPLKVRSLVGLMPLLAVMTLEPDDLEKLPGFKKRMDWFIENRPDICDKTACMVTPGQNDRRLLAILDKDRLTRLLGHLLDENEFLSPYGIRSLSKCHGEHPYSLEVGEHCYTVDYEPGESTSTLFGGNSNWRGPVWMPINYLIIESLQKFHHYYGDDLKVQCPTGSGNFVNLWDVASELSLRLTRLFTSGACFGDQKKYSDPHFKDHLLFNEYFHGETGAGLGACHQTGWTGLISKLIQQLGEYNVI